MKMNKKGGITTLIRVILMIILLIGGIYFLLQHLDLSCFINCVENCIK